MKNMFFIKIVCDNIVHMSYNISFTIASLIIGIILILIVSLNYSSTNLVNKRYKYFLFSSITMFVLDLVTVFTNDNADKINEGINYFLNSLYFFNGAVVALLFLYYSISVAFVDSKREHIKIHYTLNISIIGIYFITLVINCFTGFYFNFDNQTYNHGSLYLLVNLCAVIFLIETFVIFIVKRKKFNFKQRICTALFYAAFFSAFILQLTAFQDILLSDFGVALGALIIFFSIETPDYVKLMQTLYELNELKASLEVQVEDRTKEVYQERQSYKTLTLETLSSLAELIDAKDHYTNGHSFRVAAYAKALAKELGYDSEAEQIYFAGLVHDVGKIGIGDKILTKPGKLTKEEYEIIKSHASVGGNILKGIHQFKVFETVARYHHERYDGSGYPDNLKGEDIPFEARIVAVCDVYDAMTSDRSYRKALSEKVALKELNNIKGSQLDPHMVDVFLDICKRYPNSLKKHIDELKA